MPLIISSKVINTYLHSHTHGNAISQVFVYCDNPMYISSTLLPAQNFRLTPFRLSSSRISNMTCTPTNKAPHAVTKKMRPVVWRGNSSASPSILPSPGWRRN